MAVPESLYRASRLHEMPESERKQDSGGGELSWQGFGQDSMMLMDVRNLLEALLAVESAKAGGHPETHMLKPPHGRKPAEKTEDASYESMLRMLSGE